MYYGYIWSGVKWERVTEEPMEMGACAKALRRIEDERGSPARYSALTSGATPDWTPGKMVKIRASS